MLSETINALTSGVTAIKQVDHNIKWWAIMAAISIAKAAMVMQSSESFAKQSKFLKRFGLISSYGLAGILVFVQFSPWIIAFWKGVFKYAGGLF